jgi:hypothetical protein
VENNIKNNIHKAIFSKFIPKNCRIYGCSHKCGCPIRPYFLPFLMMA